MRSPRYMLSLMAAITACCPVLMFSGEIALAAPEATLAQEPLPTAEDSLIPLEAPAEAEEEESESSDREENGETSPPILYGEEDFFGDDFLTPNPGDPVPSADDIGADIGELQILTEPQPPTAEVQPSTQPTGQLLLRSTAFTSSNVSANSVDSTSDVVFDNRATLLVTPKLGPSTHLVATAGGGLARFAEEGDTNNYNSFGVSVGVQQRLGDGMYGQIGWVNDNLYNINSGDRTFGDNSARLLIGRQDQLGEDVRLDTTYELRARFTDPSDRSRISNRLSARVRYDFSPQWQGAVGYRLALDEYTRNGRSDTSHQLQATTTYAPTKDTFVTGFASYAFGNSSEASVELENVSFGVGVGVNLPLF